MLYALSDMTHIQGFLVETQPSPPPLLQTFGPLSAPQDQHLMQHHPTLVSVEEESSLSMHSVVVAVVVVIDRSPWCPGRAIPRDQ